MTMTDRLVAVLRETLHESGHEVSEQTARYVLGNVLAEQESAVVTTPGYDTDQT